MAFYVVQHGMSLSKKLDPQKGLSPQGRQEVQRIAQVAAGYQVSISLIQHSGKLRAAQTAQIFGEYLKPKNGLQDIAGINPLDDVAGYATGIDMAEDRMVVSHLPFLERLVAYLITGNETPPVFRLQNAGVLCLDYYPDTQNVVIKWGLMPKIP